MNKKRIKIFFKEGGWWDIVYIVIALLIGLLVFSCIRSIINNKSTNSIMVTGGQEGRNGGGYDSDGDMDYYDYLRDQEDDLYLSYYEQIAPEFEDSIKNLKEKLDDIDAYVNDALESDDINEIKDILDEISTTCSY